MIHCLGVLIPQQCPRTSLIFTKCVDDRFSETGDLPPIEDHPVRHHMDVLVLSVSPHLQGLHNHIVKPCREKKKGNLRIAALQQKLSRPFPKSHARGPHTISDGCLLHLSLQHQLMSSPPPLQHKRNFFLLRLLVTNLYGIIFLCKLLQMYKCVLVKHNGTLECPVTARCHAAIFKFVGCEGAVKIDHEVYVFWASGNENSLLFLKLRFVSEENSAPRGFVSLPLCRLLLQDA
mmetsp:Transcript_43950/g.86759  ORF Transcript_43950/g.86759 Transcript_43950/m.86759 type:complete len:233 (-) Transcript_43950:250-948(-)